MNVLEVRRQFLHLVFGLTVVALFSFDFISASFIFALLVTLLIVSLLSRKGRVPFFEELLLKLDREEDRKSIPAWGAITYLLGVFLAMAFFEKDVASAALVILAVGDSVAPMIGIHFGRTQHPLNAKKEIEGGLAGFVAAFLIAWLFVAWYEAALAAFVGMVFEALDLKCNGKDVFNDNITIPLLSGFALVVLRFLIG